MSHMAAARQVFYVHFLFVLLDGAKTHNLALERLVSYRFVRIIVMYRLLTLAKTDRGRNLPYLPAPQRLIVASWLFVFVACWENSRRATLNCT